MGNSPKFQISTGKICRNSETVPSCTLFSMIYSEGVHDTFIYNMDKFSILKVIWSIDIWDDVHILVQCGAPHWEGGCRIPFIPPFPFKVDSLSRQCVLLNDKYCVLLSDILGCFHTD